MLAHVDGSLNTPQDEVMARFASGIRQTLTSIQLGSATLSAISDHGTIAMTANAFGGSGTRALSRMLGEYLPSSKADREKAAQLGLILDYQVNAGVAQARFLGEVVSGGVAERFSDATMRVSFLSQMTSAHRNVVKKEFMATLADNRAKGWDDIAAPLRDTLERRGITEADWQTIREVPPVHADTGAGFIVPDHLRKLGPEHEALATRLAAIMREQVELAVPSSSIRARVQITGGAPGTIGGELTRSALMYKSFAMSVVYNQLRRRVAQKQYVSLATYIAVMTILGGISMNLKEIAKGRDPQPMDNMKFWYRAALQGGGLGIFGDFIVSEQNRFGGGLAETAAGPVVGLVGSILGAPSRALGALATGDDTNAGREAANLLRYNMPVASSLWYTRAAIDRVFFDEIQALLDPEAQRAWRRREQRQRREYGNESWWRQGRSAPDRAPDLGGILSSGS